MSDMGNKIGRTRYILVIDADVNERFTMSMLLQRFGYTVSSARSIDEAIDFLCVAPAVAVFAEAGTLGSDLRDRIADDPRFRDVPLVLVTDAEGEQREQIARLKGLSGLLRKPLNAEEVFKVVQVVIEKGLRRNIRVGTSLPALVREGTFAMTGYVTILSQYGLFFRTLTPREARSQVTVDFEIWGRTISVEASVLYCVTFDEGPFCEPGMGVKFIRISPENSALVRAYILDQLCGDFIPQGTDLGYRSGMA